MSSQDEVELEVSRILISDLSESQILYFKEAAGERSFPFVIGLVEVTTVLMTLEGKASPRPLTHDAWLSTIRQLGGMVVAVVITRLFQETYYSEIRVSVGDRPITIDARPSDATIIALKASAPILIRREVLEEALS